jgi:hypothetical protein
MDSGKVTDVDDFVGFIQVGEGNNRNGILVQATSFPIFPKTKKFSASSI